MTTQTNQLAEFYDYELPKDQIAQFPLENREDAKLMVVNRHDATIEHFHIRDLPSILTDQDCLVQNNSRVVPAKLNGIREQTGGRWTGLFLEEDKNKTWRMLAKTRGKVHVGETIKLIDRDGQEYCELEMMAKLEDGSWIAKCSIESPAFETLEHFGSVPLPHYIRNGNMVDDDLVNYQTVYAKENGSVAAPTAGLHFTSHLLDRLQSKNITINEVTLHVGIGTFRPISDENLESHKMHSEWGEITSAVVESINKTQRHGGRVIAVGTTSVRVMESAASDGTLKPWHGKTDLFIRPPYEFKAVDGLLTNFHLPRSTLLVLVHTFGGDELMRSAYETAVAEGYRFFSYGDAMLIL